MAQLQVRRQGEVLRVLALEMRLLSIGRTPDNGLPLRDSAVAIRHAEISLEGGVFLLTMLTSDTHLTFVNGGRLGPHQPHRLEQGDEIQIGPFSIAFLTEDRPAPERPQPHGRRLAQGELGTLTARPAVPTYAPPQPKVAGPALYHQFLPPFFQESELLGRLLKVFETIWEPLQVRQDHLDAHFDARLCPPEILTWMASWLGAPLQSHWPEGRQRAWMYEVINLYRWRGTRYGLSRALETVYGLKAVMIEDSARPHTLTVQLLDSPDGEDSASREEVAQFVRFHAPAHTLTEVEFVDPPHAGDGPPTPDDLTPDGPTRDDPMPPGSPHSSVSGTLTPEHLGDAPAPPLLPESPDLPPPPDPQAQGLPSPSRTAPHP